jgi:hypothetical protein
LEIGRFMIVIIFKRLTMALLPHKGNRGSWRCGDIPSIHNFTGFPLLQVMWIQAN